MLRFAVPLLVNKTGCELVLPTSTLPRFSDVALKEISGTGPGDAGVWANPVPDTGTFLDASLPCIEKLILPENFTAAFGVKTTRKDTPWPGDTLTGRVGPEMANCGMLLAACRISTFRLPVLSSVIA